MREFFISSFEKLISVIVIIAAVGIVIAAISVMFSAEGGILAAIAILIGGGLYLIMMAGMLYLFLGIHANTKRSADALEQLVSR